MKQIIILFLTGMLMMTACTTVPVQDFDSTKPLTLGVGTKMLTFEPKQCEKTPWEEWYDARWDGDFPSKLPADDRLSLYYSNVHYVERMTLTNENVYDEVCEACSCPRGNMLTVIVYKEQANIFENDGWTLVE